MSSEGSATNATIPAAPDGVSGQPTAIASAPSLLSQGGLDFLELDAMAEDLDLAVDPTQILERAAAQRAQDAIAGEVRVAIARHRDE